MTYLITFINRIIVVDRDFFLQEILKVLVEERGITFD